MSPRLIAVISVSGLSSEEENEVFTQELSNIVIGMRARCRPGKKKILMAHYTVPGCNTESGQTMMLTQFEPIIPQEALLAAGYDLVALGHIHRPPDVPPLPLLSVHPCSVSYPLCGDLPHP